MNTLNINENEVRTMTAAEAANGSQVFQIGWMMLNTVEREEGQSPLQHFQAAREAWALENDEDARCTFDLTETGWLIRGC